MRILYHKVLIDDEFIEFWYSTTDQIRNQGRLALVSSIYFPFGHKLLKKTCKNLNSKYLKEKNQVYKDTKNTCL